MVSEKSFFFHVFSIVSLWPRAGHEWTPGPRLAGFIKRTTIHCYTQNMKALGLVVSEKFSLLHTKYESSGPCCFGDVFFYVFPIVCLWELMTPGAGPFLTPRA